MYFVCMKTTGRDSAAVVRTCEETAGDNHFLAPGAVFVHSIVEAQNCQGNCCDT